MANLIEQQVLSRVRNLERVVNTVVPRVSSEVRQAMQSQLTNKQEVFLSSGTFTVPADVTTVYVTMIGGGGSGGVAVYSDNDTASNRTCLATGGASGELISMYPVEVTPLDNITVTVGLGGSAGSVSVLTATSVSSSVQGTDGEDTLLGTVRAVGGKGGRATITASTSTQLYGVGLNKMSCSLDGRDPGTTGPRVLFTGNEQFSNKFNQSVQTQVSAPNSKGAGATAGVVAELASALGATQSGECEAQVTGGNFVVPTGNDGALNSGSGGGAVALCSYTQSTINQTINSGAGADGICIVQWLQKQS